MRTELQHLMRSEPWAILPEAFALLVAHEVTGGQIDDDEPELLAARRLPASQAKGGAIAVVPVRGLIVHRESHRPFWMQSTAVESLTALVSALVADDQVASVVLDVDSPGGAVGGLLEWDARLAALRGRKPIVANANATAASAAYHIASQADELAVTPSGSVGSIGVFTYHDNMAGMAEKWGIERTYIYAGEHKVEGHPFAPLSDAAREHLQQRVDAVHDEFVRAVATGRRVSQAKVREEFGRGRMVEAERALQLGMVDRVETIEDTLGRLAARSGATSVLAAEADRERLRLATALAQRR